VKIRHRVLGIVLAASFLVAALAAAGGFLTIEASALGTPARELEARVPLAAALSGLLAAAVASALAYWHARRWLRPLEDVVAASRRLAAGELESPVRTDSEGEIGEIETALERTRGTLLRKIRQLEGQYHLLELVFGGMKEALLVVDEERRVKLVNQAFRDVFRPAVIPEGRALSEVVRDPQVLRIIGGVLETGAERRERLPRLSPRGRAFEVISYALRTDDVEGRVGAVALFFDVTRIEKLEETRREFVANVSHELRTPLTSIKASAITLMDGTDDDVEMRERFLGTIVRQADRMTALVSDLTDLSKIETGAIELDVRDVDVAALAHDVFGQVAPRYEARELTTRIEMDSPFVIRADRGRVEQILVNLIDNAMKFSRPGGTVTVRGLREDDGPIIEVEDNGEGISSEAQEKVFQRFYRVDPSRSREMGGTGLGLSIVKHLMNLHRGRISLRSELGKGSCFTLRFPR
jgi:two-component system phosphate regulon sensor histidine kinase PhoR